MTTPPAVPTLDEPLTEQSLVSISRARLAELEQAEQLARTLLAASPDYMFVVDRSGRYCEILRTQTATAEVLLLVGKLFTELLPKELAERFVGVIAQVLATAAPITITYPLPVPAGSRWFSATVLPKTRDTVLWISRDITEQHESKQGEVRQAQDARLHLFEALIENALDGISVASPEGVILYGNPAFKTMTGYGDDLWGVNFRNLYTAESQARLESETSPALLTTGRWRGELQAVRPDGSEWSAQLSVILLTDVGAEPRFATILRDQTENRRAEQERLNLREKVIATQQAILREMATPLIPLTDHVVVLPLVGSVDSARAQQILETLLDGVVAHRAKIVIVDISGVKIVDTQVADALLRAARAVKLVGAELILTGIRPEIAQTIVRLGADLQHLRTLASLQAALRYVLSKKATATPSER